MESDNNVKLIVLDRLDTLQSKHGHILDGLIMVILQVLSRLVFVFYCFPFADGDLIHVGPSKFITVPIDEDSHERILNCI